MGERCPSTTPIRIFGFEFGGGHQWEHNTMWSSSRAVVPFHHRSVPRSGHRCANCGAFKWDQSDEKFSRDMLFSLDAEARAYFHQKMGRDRWGREMHWYDQCVTLKGRPFRAVVIPGQVIEVRCGDTLVARWSSGYWDSDLQNFGDWLELTGRYVEGAGELMDGVAA